MIKPTSLGEPEEWQALTDACVSLFAAEEAKWSDGGPSGKPLASNCCADAI